MQKYLRNAFIFLFFVFALLAVMGGLTNATEVLKTANIELLAIACIFFIFSIIIWLISWAYLIKKRNPAGFRDSLVIGFSAVYASLTPIQLGADMLRAVSLKEHFGVPYSESISASMVVKGMKFLLISLLSGTVIFLFISSAEYSPFVLAGLLSGFAVILLATALFLLPLREGFGLRIAGIFKRFSGRLPLAGRLCKFFESYSEYLPGLGAKTFLLTLLLSGLSLSLEFLALLFSFKALSIAIPIYSVAVLFILVSILERTPFLPRGIGLVEGIGFAFLSMPIAVSSLSIQQIGALLILFDLVRLVVPAIASMAVYSVASLKQNSNYAKQL